MSLKIYITVMVSILCFPLIVYSSGPYYVPSSTISQVLEYFKNESNHNYEYINFISTNPNNVVNLLKQLDVNFNKSSLLTAEDREKHQIVYTLMEGQTILMIESNNVSRYSNLYEYDSNKYYRYDSPENNKHVFFGKQLYISNITKYRNCDLVTIRNVNEDKPITTKLIFYNRTAYYCNLALRNEQIKYSTYFIESTRPDPYDIFPLPALIDVKFTTLVDQFDFWYSNTTSMIITVMKIITVDTVA